MTSWPSRQTSSPGPATSGGWSWSRWWAIPTMTAGRSPDSRGRTGLRYALGRIAAGEARGLVVPGLRRLTRSVAELGPILDWCLRHQARLVAVAQGLDTAQPESRIAARLIIEVSRWERERLSESLREGQSPSQRWTAPAVVDDDPDLYSHSGGERS